MASSLTSSPIASPFPSRKSLPQPSVPPSPARDRKADSLRLSMARHQASLSRPDSPSSCHNDDIPRFTLTRQNSLQPDRLRRRDERSYRTVAATATKSSLGEERQGKTAALGDVNRKEEELLSSRYPRLSSHPTYSLPRNTRLYKSSKRMTESLRESQESLLLPSTPSTSSLHLPESRDSLLKRYPSSSLARSPSFSSSASPSSRASSPVSRGTPFREASIFSSNYPRDSYNKDEHSARGAGEESSSASRYNFLSSQQHQQALPSSPVRQELRQSVQRSLPLGYHSLQSSRRQSPVRYDSRQSSRRSSPLRYDSLQSSRRSSPVRYDSVQSSRRSSPVRYDSRHSSRRSSPTRYDASQSLR